MARNSRLNVCLPIRMANSSQTHCARSIASARHHARPGLDRFRRSAPRPDAGHHPATSPPGRRCVDQPSGTGAVAPQPPIANRLQTNPAKVGRSAAGAALINRRQREQPTDLVCVTAGPRQRPHPRRREIIPKRHCRCHRQPPSGSRPLNRKSARLGIPCESALTGFGMRRFQSRSSGSPARAWAVTKVRVLTLPRMVSEIVPEAAAALAAVIPGQMRTGMPCADRAAISSLARPKIAGSPPLSRTTRLPACAASMRRWPLAAWSRECRPERLPTLMRSAEGRPSSSTRGPTSASKKTTSAASSSRSALRVRSSGSPGPAPTSQTELRGKSSGNIRSFLGREELGERRAARSAVGPRA